MYTNDTLEKAWKMRQQGMWTMREIANKLGCQREQLISDLEAWLAAQHQMQPTAFGVSDGLPRPHYHEFVDGVCWCGEKDTSTFSRK